TTSRPKLKPRLPGWASGHPLSSFRRHSGSASRGSSGSVLLRRKPREPRHQPTGQGGRGVTSRAIAVGGASGSITFPACLITTRQGRKRYSAAKRRPRLPDIGGRSCAKRRSALLAMAKDGFHL